MDWRGTFVGELTKGKLQEEARTRRYRLLLDACRRHNTGIMLTGHNLDDDIATMFYRMSHGSGLDGLAAMKQATPFPVQHHAAGHHLIGHPLLDIPKARLIETCHELGLSFISDRSNGDLNYQRNQIMDSLQVLQQKGVLSTEELTTMLKLFKETRRHVQEQLTRAFERSVIVNKQLGESTLILNDSAWLMDRPIATRLIGLLVQFGACKQYPSRTIRINSIYDQLLRCWEAHEHSQRKWLSHLPRIATENGAGLLPMDLTKRVNMPQQTTGGSTFYSLARIDAMRRISLQERLENRKLKSGPAFLIQREPPARVNTQQVLFNPIDLEMRPGQWYLWDDRQYLQFMDPSQPETDPKKRRFLISMMTPADIKEFEALTPDDSSLRRRLYSVLGCTPGSHLYAIPVIREPETGYMCFPTLQTDQPKGLYHWRSIYAGNSILTARFHCLP